MLWRQQFKEQYVGEWVDDLMQGVGKMELADGSVQEGHFFKGLQHGQGMFMSAFPDPVKDNAN